MRDWLKQGAEWAAEQGNKIGRAYMAGVDNELARVEAHKAALKRVLPTVALETAPKSPALRGPVAPESVQPATAPRDPYSNAGPEDFAGNETWAFPAGRHTDWNRKKPGQGDGRFGTGFRIGSDGQPRPHHGVDITMPVGEPVYADRDGQVFSAGPVRGYGLMIDAGPSMADRSRYAHLDEILVKPGQRVTKGEQIGRSGRSGNAASSPDAHLHYEVYAGGQRVDPYRLFAYGEASPGYKNAP